jgi:hypothetical protein
MGLWTRTERPFLGIATPPLYGNGESELENRHFLTKQTLNGAELASRPKANSRRIQ